MSRQKIRETRIVPEHEETIMSWTVTCDRCGAESERWHEGTNELVIALDPEECVSYVHRRDYCGDCASYIWAGICAIVGVSPDDEGRHGYDDD
jgi:hypothetical protein